MALLGRYRRRSPRLRPELDDDALRQVCRHLSTPASRGQPSVAIALMEELLDRTGQDWDRRAHRIGVLAEAAGRAAPKTWLRQRPRDHNALTLHAWSDLAHAHQDGSFDDSGATVNNCLQAADLAPSDPTPWVVLLSVFRLQQRPPHELASVWREIKARDPWNREAHLQALRYLSPFECGSKVKVLEFLDGLRSAPSYGTPVTGVELAAHVDHFHHTQVQGGIEALSIQQHWARVDVQHALDHASEHWHRPGVLTHAAALADLNLLTYALVRARRFDEATRTMNALDGTATAWPWGWDQDALEMFTSWHNRLTR
ncbi:hypothetical protein [Streptomyces chartreusis]|uniref:hypothetical protein n=1 Tax=Streptomyces chartreusis TaxID=1969 RepID=UPI0037F74FE1